MLAVCIVWLRVPAVPEQFYCFVSLPLFARALRCPSHQSQDRHRPITAHSQANRRALRAAPSDLLVTRTAFSSLGACKNSSAICGDFAPSPLLTTFVESCSQNNPILRTLWKTQRASLRCQSVSDDAECLRYRNGPTYSPSCYFVLCEYWQ